MDVDERVEGWVGSILKCNIASEGVQLKNMHLGYVCSGLAFGRS